MESRLRIHRAWRYRAQQGYILLILTFAVALLLVAIAVAVPTVTAELRREREEELMHRGSEYARAIRRFHHKFGTFPATIEQLEDSNHIRFLRRRYKDPLTGDDFRLVHAGEVQLMPNLPGASQSSAPPGNRFFDSQPGNDSHFDSGPILGVASTSNSESFHVFNDNNHYKDWLFVYSPALENGTLIRHPYDGIRSFPQFWQLGDTSGANSNVQGSGTGTLFK
jgi:type II secretory pathway pseudopilin PulG